MIFFEQILAHGLGDYVLQTDKMARQKTSSEYWAWLHALVYGIPFMLLGASILALIVIVGSHYLIDRHRLARYVVLLKTVMDYAFDGPTEVRTRIANLNKFGFPQGTPDYIGFWILIVVDNLIHVTINYYALLHLS